MLNHMNNESNQISVSHSADERSRRIIGAVMQNIEKNRVFHAKFSAAMNGVLAILSLAAFVPAIGYLMGTASQTGFFTYASLLISDTGSVAHSWNTFLVSIADSAPLMGIMAVITVILVLAISARSLARSMMSLSIRHAYN
jgi:hypothetical protein